MGDRTGCWWRVALVILWINIVAGFRYEIPRNSYGNDPPSFSFVTGNNGGVHSSGSGTPSASFSGSEYPPAMEDPVDSARNSQEPVVGESRIFRDRQLFPPEEPKEYSWREPESRPYGNDGKNLVFYIFMNFFRS